MDGDKYLSIFALLHGPLKIFKRIGLVSLSPVPIHVYLVKLGDLLVRFQLSYLDKTVFDRLSKLVPARLGKFLEYLIFAF